MVDAGIYRYGGEKRWLAIACDGLPYSMVYKIIQQYVICNLCQKQFMGITLYRQHAIEDHAGHYEMNLMKSFVDLNWEVFFKSLVQRMGWNSEFAMQSARKCHDNHKLIMATYYGVIFWHIRRNGFAICKNVYCGRY